MPQTLSARSARRISRPLRRVDSLRIGILSPPWFPVPPTRYGGIEAVVSLLADGLVTAGHDVTLYASGDSRTRARMVSAFDVAPSERLGDAPTGIEHALACLEEAGTMDVISDHTGIIGVTLCGLVDTPSVHTVHGPLVGRDGDLYRRMLQFTPRAQLISLTHAQRRPHPEFPWLATVGNAIDFAAHPCRSSPGGDYLFWMGRMSPEKAPELAIAVARAAGLPLILAGKCREPAEHEHFAKHVAPLLGDGVEYVGEVGPQRRVALLHGAIALVNPIQWEEPFGLVMIEAMACGVPVLATRRGSAPEVVEHGRSGLIVDHVDDMAAAVDETRLMSPAECRASAEERFTPARMVEQYAAAFASAADGERSLTAGLAGASTA